MIAFPEMLGRAAKEAGIKTPKDLRKYNRDKYCRWEVFCCAQLGQPMPSPSAHWANAKVIAQLKEDELKTISMKELIERGFQVGYPTL